MMTAAGHEDPRYLKGLLQAGAEPNLRSGDAADSALMVAVKSGRLENINLLMRYGGDPNVRTPDGKTAFKLAKKHWQLLAALQRTYDAPKPRCGRGPESE